MPNVNTEKLFGGLQQYFETPEIAANVAKLKEHFSAGAVVALCAEAIQQVEKLAADLGEVAGTGEAKKAAVKQWLDDVIELPKILEWADDIAINGLVDATVTWYNFKHGKDWVTKITSVL